jgi:hypothetical protein
MTRMGSIGYCGNKGHSLSRLRMHLGVSVSFVSLIRTDMSLALQRCCRRENDSAKRRVNASLGNVPADLIQTDLIQTDFSLAGEDAGCRTGTDELQSGASASVCARPVV